jgi:predicted O-methyltransferase YrrM
LKLFRLSKKWSDQPALGARHAEWSIISSADDLSSQPTAELIRTLLNAAEQAETIDLGDVAARCQSPDDRRLVTQWPGEHYRLLAGLVAIIKPRIVVEVGTFTGWGALSLLQRLPPGGRVVSYDVVPWTEFRDTALRPEDFGPRLEQRIADLSIPSVFDRERDILSAADLIFVDGPKDGLFELAFCDRLNSIKTGALIIFDDIRVLNMITFWRELPWPKLDATSLGHWSGTGLARLGPARTES